MIKKYRLEYTILIAFFVIGLLTTSAYGISWDEDSEKNIMRANIKEYVLRLFPQDSNVYKEYSDLDVIRISENVERDHGAAVMYFAEIFLSSDLSGDYKIFLWHLYIYLIFFLSVLSMYYICKYLFSHTLWGLLGASIYYITPRIFAEAHYNNKDVILLSLLVCTFALFISLIEHFSYKKLICTGLVSAFLINARIVGLAVFGFFSIYYLYYMIYQKTARKIIFQRITVGLCTVAIMYYLITPALWGGQFFDFLKHLIINMIRFERWNSAVFFRGSLVRPVPRYYLPWMILITTPLYVILGFVFGNIVLVTDWIKHKKDFLNDWKKVSLAVIDLTCLIPIIFAVIVKSRTYNGWRHFYFVYGGIVIMTVYAVYILYQHIQNKYRLLLKGCIIVAILVTCLSMVENHPYQYTYFNFLAGDAGNLYELDYWNVSVPNALDQLLISGDRENLTIGACDGWTRDGLAKNVCTMGIRRFQAFTYMEDWEEANYVIINNTYAFIASGTPAYQEKIQYVRNTYKKVVSVNAYGNEICAIYQK